MIIHSKHNGFVKGVRRVYDSGSSGPSETTQKVDVPDWAKPYAQETLAKASALSQAPYQAYTGDRLAQFTPLQQQAFQAAGQQGIAGQLGQATGIAGSAAQGALGAGAGFNPYQTGQFTGQTAQQYMDPYMQSVVGIQQREAQRQAGIAGTQRAGEATRAGAFGGGRQAVVEAEAGRNLATQLGDIQAQGLQAAYGQAQDQFNREQQLAEQSRQYGAGLGLQGFQAALQGAGTLGNLGQAQFGQQMDVTNQQQQLGALQQQQAQKGLTTAYEDFLAQQRAPYQQIEFINNMARGLGSTTSIYTPQPSTASQLIGAGTTAAGFLMAEGGEVPGYAGGGLTGLLSDQQLQQRMGTPTISGLAQMAAQKELMDRGQMRSGMQPQGQAPQASVADEVAAGLGALDVDPMGMAGGGIVSFQEGGDVSQLGAQYDAARNAYQQSLDLLRRYGGAQRLADRAGYDAAVEAQRQAAQDLEAAKTAWGSATQSMAPPALMGQRVPLRSPPPSAAEGITALPSARDQMLRKRQDPASGGVAAALAARSVDAGRTVADKAPPTGAPVARGPAPAPTGIAQTAPGMSAAEQYVSEQERLSGFKDYSEQTRKDAEDIGRMGREQTQQDQAEFDKEVAERGALGAEREKRLAAQETRAEEGAGKNLKMTLIEAGLAIMGGQSPNALTNLAAGAASGLKGYQARLNKYETEKQRLDEARAELDDLRRQEAIATGKERRDLRGKARAAEIDAKKALMGANSALFNTRGKLVESAVDMAFKEKESALQRANTLELGRIQMSGSGAAGGGGSGLAAQKEKRMLLTAQANVLNQQLRAKQNEFGPAAKEEARRINAELTAVQAALRELGPDTGQAAAAPVNSGGAQKTLDYNAIK